MHRESNSQQDHQWQHRPALQGACELRCSATPAVPRSNSAGATAVVLVITAVVAVAGLGFTVALDRSLSGAGPAHPPAVEAAGGRSGAATGTPAGSGPATPTDPASATVRVESEGCGGVSAGTGFVVNHDLVATAAHVVAGSTGVVLYRPDGSSVVASVVRFDPDTDLALLAANGLGLPALGLDLPRKGEAVEAWGHSEGVPLGVKPGEVTEVGDYMLEDIYRTGNETETELVVVDSEIEPGDSGGPLTNAEGKAVGVVSLGGEGDGVAVSARLLAQLAQDPPIDVGELARCDLPGFRYYGPA